MQKVQLNKETGSYEMVNVDGSAITESVAVAEPPISTSGPSTYLELINERAQRRQATEDQAIEQELDAISRGEDQRPVFAQDAGMFARDLGRIGANAAVSIGTDYVDLGLGVADVVGQTAQILTGQRNGYNPDELFNDADNPLTKWRREFFKTETVAGQAASNLARLGTAIVTLPKTAIKGIAAPAKILAKAPGIGKTFGKVAGALNKADDVLKSSRAPKVTKAMEALDLTTKAGKNAAKAVANNDWLTYTFKDIAKSTETANWWKGVSNSAAALTSIKKVKGTKAKIRTVGEALGWDAFVAFNVFGEGQDDFDETLTDFLAENNLPRIGYFETDVLDSSIEKKWKQMLEGVVTAIPMSAMVDMIRIRKFSKAFSAASDTDKAKIVAAFNDEAETLGRGFSRFFDDGADDAGKGFSQLPITNESSWSSMRPGFDPSMDPWSGGALARLNTQSDLVKLADQRITDIEGLSAAAPGPKGMTPRLGQGQQPLVEGADQARLAGRTDAALPPGSSPEPKAGGVNQLDRSALRPGMNPLQGQPQLAGRDQAQLAGRTDAALPPGSSPEPKTGTPPRQALGAGGELVDGRIDPVRVEITPRNPSPTATPQTIRTAFEEDAYRAFRQSMELTYEEVAPGQMQQVQRQIERLMPETRVDAIDYMKRNPITANELGVIDAPQSVWSNFIVNRGLFEGWATIGDDMQIRFLRNPAAGLDRGELAEKSAKALDEAVDNELFNENMGRLIVDVNSDPVVDAKLKNNVVTSKTAEERFDLGEEVRLSAAEQAALEGASSDEDVVRQALGIDLADIKGPDVEKVEGSRGWVMLGEDGEELGRFTRKSQALKAAERETDRLKAEALNRARQIEADGMEQVMQTADINPVYTSDLTANVKLSKAQVDELLRYSDVVRKQIRINKNTYTFSQGEMFDLIDGLTALKQTGEMKGNRLRVINNLIDKLDTQMKLLSPAARAIKQAQDLAVDAGRFLKNGEFC